VANIGFGVITCHRQPDEFTMAINTKR